MRKMRLGATLKMLSVIVKKQDRKLKGTAVLDMLND
jgi:hypothetical protein